MGSGLFPSLQQAIGHLTRTRRPSLGEVRGEASQLKLRYLQEVDIFRDLSPEEMAWVKDTTRMVTCPAGRIIYGQEERVEVLFILKRGRVQMYRLRPDGKKLGVATIGPGTFFGDMPFIGQRMHHTFAEALEESLICVMSRDDVERLILKKPQVAIRMLEVVSDRLQATESQLESLAFQSAAARLAQALLRMADGNLVRATHQELSEAIGAYRETVTKTVDEFQRAGMVELGRNRITLVDRERLEAIAGQ